MIVVAQNVGLTLKTLAQGSSSVTFYWMITLIISRIYFCQFKTAVNRLLQGPVGEQLATLHWLPVKQWWRYKALLFGRRIAHADRNAPAYFSNVHCKRPKRCTRLTGPLLESSYKPKLAAIGYRSFDLFALPLWNSLSPYYLKYKHI